MKKSKNLSRAGRFLRLVRLPPPPQGREKLRRWPRNKGKARGLGTRGRQMKEPLPLLPQSSAARRSSNRSSKKKRAPTLPLSPLFRSPGPGKRRPGGRPRRGPQRRRQRSAAWLRKRKSGTERRCFSFFSREVETAEIVREEHFSDSTKGKKKTLSLLLSIFSLPRKSGGEEFASSLLITRVWGAAQILLSPLFPRLAFFFSLSLILSPLKNSTRKTHFFVFFSFSTREPLPFQKGERRSSRETRTGKLLPP
jgi:hypothetical protein